MARKLKIGILMGGPSSEHGVSLRTGENVYSHLDTEKYEPTRLVLSPTLELSEEGVARSFPKDLKKFDLIFLALHGTFGEDGTIQSILDELGVRYTGSGAEASRLGMDKCASALQFSKVGLRTPQFRMLSRGEESPDTFPLVLKVRAGGSSIGVDVIFSKEDFEERIKDIADQNEYLVQEYVRGHEFTCGILEVNGEPRALPVVEIRTQADFFDYETKYDSTLCEEVVPANIPEALSLEIQKAALLAHQTIGARGYSRSDFMWDGEQIFILEINTLPGLTKDSLLPKAALAACYSFDQLLGAIVSSAVRVLR